jgi:hypothetical protein
VTGEPATRSLWRGTRKYVYTNMPTHVVQARAPPGEAGHRGTPHSKAPQESVEGLGEHSVSAATIVQACVHNSVVHARASSGGAGHEGNPLSNESAEGLCAILVPAASDLVQACASPRPAGHEGTPRSQAPPESAEGLRALPVPGTLVVQALAASGFSGHEGTPHSKAPLESDEGLCDHPVSADMIVQACAHNPAVHVRPVVQTRASSSSDGSAARPPSRVWADMRDDDGATGQAGYEGTPRHTAPPESMEGLRGNPVPAALVKQALVSRGTVGHDDTTHSKAPPELPAGRRAAPVLIDGQPSPALVAAFMVALDAGDWVEAQRIADVILEAAGVSSIAELRCGR